MQWYYNATAKAPALTSECHELKLAVAIGIVFVYCGVCDPASFCTRWPSLVLSLSRFHAHIHTHTHTHPMLYFHLFYVLFLCLRLKNAMCPCGTVRTHLSVACKWQAKSSNWLFNSYVPICHRLLNSNRTCFPLSILVMAFFFCFSRALLLMIFSVNEIHFQALFLRFV